MVLIGEFMLLSSVTAVRKKSYALRKGDVQGWEDRNKKP